ncbi:MAG: DHHA1 domain-containing protein, partial [Firmicutes bacterium]|nr:DHHA1 domain-containing protein [Bacillota bacterium]
QEKEKELAKYQAYELVETAKIVEDVKLIAAVIPGSAREILRSMGDNLKAKLGSGIIVLGSEVEGKAVLISMVTKDLIEKGFNAGSILSQIASIIEGSGGGRADMAQAGGKNPAKLKEAIDKVEFLIRSGTALSKK